MAFFLLCPANALAFWYDGIDIDSTDVAVYVVDPDIMGIDNYEAGKGAIVVVECPQETPDQHPFSNCANGCPMYPNNSIRFMQGVSKVCEGDTIFVFQKNVKFKVWKLLRVTDADLMVPADIAKAVKIAYFLFLMHFNRHQSESCSFARLSNWLEIGLGMRKIWPPKVTSGRRSPSGTIRRYAGAPLVNRADFCQNTIVKLKRA